MAQFASIQRIRAMAVVSDVRCKSHILFLRVLHLGTETFEWFFARFSLIK